MPKGIKEHIQVMIDRKLEEASKFGLRRIDHPLTHHFVNELIANNGWKKHSGMEEVPKNEREDWEASEQALKTGGHTHDSISDGWNNYFTGFEKHGNPMKAEADSGFPHEAWTIADHYS